MQFDVKNISKQFGDKEVLKDISFSVTSGEFISIIGPSGSGKTTLLKIIARMDDPNTGDVTFEKEISKQNPVILVFQDFLLFPSMTVFDNVAFGLKVRKIPKMEIKDRVNRILSYFGILEKSKAYPAHLSGGQKQRVALARAMVINPSVLLLDEPFANLDKNLKMETAEFIRETQKEFGITTISVTHDQGEAFAMSDKIGILLDGRLIQFDTVEQVYHKPANLEAAEFLGPVNKIPLSLLPRLGREIPGDFTRDEVYSRAEMVKMTPDFQGDGIIENVCFIGLMILYTVKIGELPLKIYSLENTLKQGDRVSLYLTDYF